MWVYIVLIVISRFNKVMLMIFAAVGVKVAGFTFQMTRRVSIPAAVTA